MAVFVYQAANQYFDLKQLILVPSRLYTFSKTNIFKNTTFFPIIFSKVFENNRMLKLYALRFQLILTSL